MDDDRTIALVSQLDLRRHGGTWLGQRAVGTNPSWEVEVDGDEAGPDATLLEVVAITLAVIDELVALAVQHLEYFTRFGPAAPWYPEGARYTLGSEDKAGPEVILDLAIEDDFYSLWSVALQRSLERWYVRSFTRSQQ